MRQLKLLILGLIVSASALWADYACADSVDRALHHPHYSLGNTSVMLLFEAWGPPSISIQQKSQLVQETLPKWISAGGNQSLIQPLRQRLEAAMSAGDHIHADLALDEILRTIGVSYDRQFLAKRHRHEFDQFLLQAQSLALKGDVGIEDYVGWAVVEPQPNTNSWSIYQKNAAQIKSKGYKYIPYLLLLNLPHWVRSSDKYVFAQNILNGKATEFLSIYAPQTMAAYDHLLSNLKQNLGASIDVLRLGTPYDFGETAYVGGAPSDPFPMKNKSPGFWVGEKPAREHFKRNMQYKYGSLQQLNAAWKTQFKSFEEINYPTSNQEQQRWLDFLEWYHNGLTEKLVDIAKIARKHFPTTPLVFNIGWPYEKVNLGQDLSGIAQALAGNGVWLRTPTGAFVPFLYTKHIATAAHFFGTGVLSSEPIDSNATVSQTALALFKDLSTGVSWHFDFLENASRSKNLFHEIGPLPQHRYPRITTAIFFPTTYHRIVNWDAWRKNGFEGGFPAGLQEFAEKLRDLIDYDVVDERLVEAGALKRYKTLIWSTGNIAARATVSRIVTWVKGGGLLIIAEPNVSTPDGATTNFAPANANGLVAFGKGQVVIYRGKLDELQRLIIGPDKVADGIFVSEFSDEVLMFNSTMSAVQKELRRNGKAIKVQLQPLQMKWIR